MCTQVAIKCCERRHFSQMQICAFHYEYFVFFIALNRNKTYSSGFSGCQNNTTPIAHFNDKFRIGFTLLLSLKQLPTVKTSVGINFVRRKELI